MDRVAEPYRDAVVSARDSLHTALGDDLVALALFGSVARGKARPDSDVDLLVVQRSALGGGWARGERAFALSRRVEDEPAWRALHERGHLAVAAFVLLSAAELEPTPRILLDLVEDAVVLLDDGTLARKLASLRLRLGDLGSRRIFLPDGTWYWDLKPDYRPGDVTEL